TLEDTNSATMTKTEMQLAWEKQRTLLKAQYFRGRVFYASRDSISNEWVTVFTSDDRKRIVSVPDSGPIYISENTGVAWKIIDRPGEYEFTLSTTPKGS